jgi:hypothetical protein
MEIMNYKEIERTEGGFYMTNYKEILEEVRDTWEVPPKVGVRIEKAIKSLQHEN